MVAMFDGQPVPKVIDFGIAKAFGTNLTELSLHTAFGAVVGTAEYMSPEQAELNNLDIDTRSDVYSLGVLMYELLTGSTPFPRAELWNVVGKKRCGSFATSIRPFQVSGYPHRRCGRASQPCVASSRKS